MNNIRELGDRPQARKEPPIDLDELEEDLAPEPRAAPAAAEQATISPGQAVAQRLLAIRNRLVAVNDTIATVLLSIHGSDETPPSRGPATQGVDHRRFFPAVVKLNEEIDEEVERLEKLAAQLDQAF